MRRPWTLVIVSALAIIAAFALADGLRSQAEPAEPPPRQRERADGTRLPERAGYARALRSAGVSGTLYVADEDCRVRPLRLPELQWVAAVPAELLECSFAVSPDGNILPGNEIVAPSAQMLSARCSSEMVVVSSLLVGREVGRVRDACAPAWKPNGLLTYVHGGEIWQSARRCIQCGRPVVRRAVVDAVASAAAEPSRHFENGAAKSVAWLDADRAVLVVEADVREQEGSHLDILAFVDGGRLLGAPLVNRRFEDVRASPDGSYVTARASLPHDVVLWNRDGRLLTETPVGGATKIVWSPDERWAAIATGGPSVFVLTTADLARFDTASRPRLLRVPVYAADLAWR
jgi:hypothetical protein